MPRPNFKKVTFLCMQQLTNFPYIEEDFDALTNYELLSKVVEYLNKVIANENTQNDSIIDLYNSFNDLKNYVDNYFENLDVQDEINNKLDEMLEDGVLEQIIEQFLQLTSLICFDNVASMKVSPNLANGSYAKTLGYSNINDGGSALYKVRTITNDDVIDEKLLIALSDNNLVAELINNKINNVKVFNDDIITAIKNSEVLYLNNTTYNINVNATITKTNIHIIGNGATINSSSNVTYIYNLNNAIIENVNFIESNITDNTKNFLFTGSNIKFKDCYLESTVGYDGEINEITFDNCELKNWYRDIHQGSGTLNKLQVLNSNFSRIQNYSTPYQADTKILIYNFNGTTSELDENMLTLHGNDIVIKNNVFDNTNKRQVQIFNVNNVIIENNAFNASGLDSSAIGGSDDLVSIDFVDYFKINNNYFGPSGENELDLLSSHFGEVSNNNFEKPYDYYVIDINYSDYIRTFGEDLIDRNLIKSSNININNNNIKDSNAQTINLTPSDSIHIYENHIINSTHQDIILLNDFGLNTPENPSGLKITNLDIGANIVKTTLGDFGRCTLRTNYEHVIDINSGHLSPDICWVDTQTVNANTMIYVTPRFPCMHGEAGKLTTNGIFRSVTPSLTTWDSTSNKSVRRGIDFISNRYNSNAYNTLFYTGDILDKYPITYVPSDVGNWDNTETSGSIVFKSW